MHMCSTHLVKLLDLRWAWRAFQNQYPLTQRHLSPPMRLQDPEEGSWLSRRCLVPGTGHWSALPHPWGS